MTVKEMFDYHESFYKKETNKKEKISKTIKDK